MKAYRLAHPALAGIIWKKAHTDEVVLRLILCKGEVQRLPRAFAIRVLAGTAWVTVNGKDIIRERGQTYTDVSRPGQPALVSSPGKAPLVLEILSPKHK